MLVVTGTQRSGTTVIAQCLAKSGYDIGTEWYDDEAEGGLDHPYICAYYRRTLRDERFPFDDMKLPHYQTYLDVEQAFRELDLPVVKFCYLLMNPAFVYLWKYVRPPEYHNDCFLVMRRSAEEVVRSKNRVWTRFMHDSLLLDVGILELEYTFNHSLNVLANLYPFRVAHFPYCLTDLAGVNKMLADLDPSVQISQEAWDSTVDTSKVHF